MIRRICKNCGGEFDAETKFIVLCPACHDKIKHSPTILKRVCKECGKSFQGGPRAWYCQECRRERVLKADREYHKNKPGRKIGSTDICERCGKQYTVSGGMQKYCSECAKTAVYEKIRDDKIKYQAEYRKNNPGARNVETVCIICGKPFMATSATATCSLECAKEAHRRAQNRADIKRGKRKSPPETRIYKKKTED